MVKGNKCPFIEDNINLILFGVLNVKDFHNIKEYLSKLMIFKWSQIIHPVHYTK